MRSCVYCKKTSIPGDKRSFHTFPTHERLKSMWIKNMRKTDWIPSKHTLLCSDHFTKSCIDFRDCRPRLRKGSIPTIFDHELDISVSAIDNIIKENKVTSNVDDVNFVNNDNSKPKIVKSDGKFSNNESPYGLKITKVTTLPLPTNSESTLLDYKPVLHPNIQVVESGKTSTTSKTHHTPMEIQHFKEIARHDHYYTYSPSEVQLKLRASQHKVMILTKEKRTLVQKVRRMQETIKSLREAVKTLRAYRGVHENDISCLR